ncbi:transcriptional regulator with XRE-family HTH domain [Sphingomonas jinjuensis]|uniref:Transcriptional regulator with XRE-family HTH domain n=1 Tax=Sphingomonas jinjuensis TaxID=535907 RepID=A0A840FHU2_9SPHN|nr:helix-turn-helix transcriptional regulator [Sphingomonas jinjuensis]MBB4152925.1 transcriptional regulator with XRE-family HTH domain [Sphingomonas jinjuensis]
MIIGQRIRERLDALGMSQSELARRVPMTQGAIAGLITGRSRSSTHLHKIARILHTTPDYLEGLTDDPDANAPPPPPAPTTQIVSLPVVLPSQPALAAMFRGLLLSVEGLKLTTDELADELATLLPTGLGQIKGRLRYVENDDADGQSSPGEDRSTDGEQRPQAQRN